MRNPWEKPNPNVGKKTAGLTAAEKARARRYASQAGRRYPNLIDNMRVIKERKNG